MRVRVSVAQFSFWISKKFLFLVAWPSGLHFWREPKISSRCYWRCLLSWQVLSQRREMRIYWWLCNNSEIHLWLWKSWGLVVCSQSSFHITRAPKDDKNRQNSLFLCEKGWICYRNNNCYLKSHFHQPNIERKNCVWTTKYKRLLAMCTVHHVETKGVFTFQPMKRLVSTTVKRAKPAATFWIFLLRTKNHQLCFLAVMEHIALPKTRAAITKKNNHLHFWRNFSANHNQAHPNLNKKGQIESKYGINVSVSYWLMIWATF